MKKNYEIKEITPEEASKLMSSVKPGEFKEAEFTPYGLFYSVEQGPDGEDFYSGYDNSTGDCWTECFDELDECLAWLNEEHENDAED